MKECGRGTILMYKGDIFLKYPISTKTTTDTRSTLTLDFQLQSTIFLKIIFFTHNYR